MLAITTWVLLTQAEGATSEGGECKWDKKEKVLIKVSWTDKCLQAQEWLVGPH